MPNKIHKINLFFKKIYFWRRAIPPTGRARGFPCHDSYELRDRVWDTAKKCINSQVKTQTIVETQRVKNFGIWAEIGYNIYIEILRASR